MTWRSAGGAADRPQKRPSRRAPRLPALIKHHRCQAGTCLPLLRKDVGLEARGFGAGGCAHRRGGVGFSQPLMSLLAARPPWASQCQSCCSRGASLPLRRRPRKRGCGDGCAGVRLAAVQARPRLPPFLQRGTSRHSPCHQGYLSPGGAALERPLSGQSCPSGHRSLTAPPHRPQRLDCLKRLMT